MDLKNRTFQGTDGIFFKVLIQGTARQGTANVEVLLFCRTLFQRSEIGLTVTFWVGLSPLNKLLNPFRFYPTLFTLSKSSIQVTYSFSTKNTHIPNCASFINTNPTNGEP